MINRHCTTFSTLWVKYEPDQANAERIYAPEGDTGLTDEETD